MKPKTKIEDKILEINDWYKKNISRFKKIINENWISHSSPLTWLRGPFTVLSESAKYLYKNNIDMRMFFNQNQFSNFNLNLKEIVKSRDLFHLFGIWDPFHD